MTQQNHLDMATVEMLLEILEDGFPTLVETFITDSQLRINEIRAGLQDANAEAVRRAAHSLKGSSSNVGAQVLTDYSQTIESSAQGGQLQGLTEKLGELEAEFLAVKNILSRMIDRVS